ncbi:NB-ARC domains-containing protein [Artemisia annua]|uniref:NB-ARC domains-containing protein n=1 Tax=Artemisia annua TaxID=35608 RepID=A0A2U1PEU1_ARTAN|nr:NB-ARC domains-containing protein [Artemisia annua]
MAEVIASTLIEAIFQKLANEALKQVGRVQGIRSELKSLEKTLYRIRALLVDASDKEIKQVLVQNWLNDLKHLAYDIDDILDDLATDAMNPEFAKNSGASTSKVRRLISSCYTNFSLCTRTHHRLDNINLRLQDLENEKTTIGLTAKNGGLEIKNDRSKDRNRKSQTCLVDASRIVGRQDDKNVYIHKLLGEPCNENFSIVPIVGLGGVGKTTLAKILYDDKQVNDQFKHKAWVCVSDEWDSFNISNIIFQCVTGETKEFKDLSLLQVALRDQLRDKLFLLVLDDVWSESSDDWESLVAPFKACAPGSKIIMTTRKEKLLRELGCGKLDHLQSLSHDNAVSLFAQHALGANNFDSHTRLKAHGEGIVRKCNGLPLALIALGRLLRGKEEEVEWKELVESEIWSLKEEGKIIPALRLSYHELPANLKQLFAYCSLLPKDYAFKKEDLVLLWMAEGFLHQEDPSKSTQERLGYKCFDELLSRSFFQQSPNDGSLFVMHDLMNDLATSVAGEFFFRLEKKMEKGDRIKALEKLRHMSFICEQYEAYKKFEVFERAKGLRTFLSLGVKERWGNCLSNKCSELTKLPKSFFKLKKLRHLDIRDTPQLNDMPSGISELKSLQTLSKIIIGGENDFSITELKDFKNLQGNISIKGLDKVKNATEAREANLLQKSLTELEVEWTDDGSREDTTEKEVLDALKPSSHGLKKLGIVNYLGLGFPKWVGDPSFHRLACVSLRACKKCTSLPPFGQLPSLKELSIQDMDDVKVVGSKFFGTGLAFPSLQILKFKGMPGWDVWSTNSRSGVGDSVFPCLKELCMEDCPKLVEVSLEAPLPSLRGLKISSCGTGVLRSLVHAAPSVTKLEIERISGLTNEVWRGVILDLKAVEELYVRSCGEIRYLWESKEAEASSKVLVNLRKLRVWECKNLVSLGEKDEEYNYGSNLLTSLRSLDVWGSENFKHLSCPNNIERLFINRCDSITCVSFFSKGGGQKLKSVSIVGCKKLMIKEEMGEGGEKNRFLINSKSMPMLESVWIDDHPNVASIIDFGGNFLHLTRLIFHFCPMDVPTAELWPPNLRDLSIGNLKKPIPEWGPQKFPASLVDLTLFGEKEEATNWSQLSHDLHLPSSLTRLCIMDFWKLETVSEGLQHLTSLQHLEIGGCPNLKDLPETLSPSLLSLRISRCPILKERCSRGGSCWRQISYIPCIDYLF